MPISTTRKQNRLLTQKVRLNKATEQNTNIPFLKNDELLLGSASYTSSLQCKLVVYQVLNLNVPHHYTNMVRLCFVRSIYGGQTFVLKAGFASERLI